jgi:hypothetical protein
VKEREEDRETRGQREKRKENGERNEKKKEIQEKRDLSGYAPTRSDRCAIVVY